VCIAAQYSWLMSVQGHNPLLPRRNINGRSSSMSRLYLKLIGSPEKCTSQADISSIPSSVRSNLLDHLVGEGDERRRHREAEHFCSPQVDDEIELDRCLHGEIDHLLTLKEAIDIGSCSTH
jgi:hypothetical protein